MQFSNMASSPAFEAEWRSVLRSDTVEFSIPVTVYGDGIYLPNPNGDSIVSASFHRVTAEEYWDIEDQTSVRVILGGGRDHTSYVDVLERRRLFLRRFLRSWSIPVELSFNEKGWLSEECYQRVVLVSSPLLMALLEKYEQDIFPDDEEEMEIEKQSALLFGRGAGVGDPCETIALYCVTTNFWDKFGLNRNDLRQLSYREFLRMRLMVSKENAVISARARAEENKARMNHARP